MRWSRDLEYDAILILFSSTCAAQTGACVGENSKKAILMRNYTSIQ